MKAAFLAIALTTIGGAAIAQTTPERDARGIPVISDPATAPPGANLTVNIPAGVQATPAPNQQQVFAPRAADREYPPCSATVTDGCVQTYERGVRRPG